MSPARDKILDAAGALIGGGGAAGVTIDAVAEAAGCSKSLVHYHFGTKSALLAAAVRHVARVRDGRWRDALNGRPPDRAVGDTWRLIQSNPETRTMVAASTLLAQQGDVEEALRDASGAFAGILASGVGSMFRATGLEATVPGEHLGWLLASVVHGLVAQLAAGGPPEALEEAYAAAWVGILSLARPA